MKKNNKTKEKEYNVLVGGAAGEGSRLAGMTIARIFDSLGWSVSIFEDYQSLIMGGHNFSKIRATKKYNTAPKNKLDYIIALNKETFDKHLKNLDKDGILIFNSDVSSSENGFGLSGKAIIEKFACKPIMKNLAFLGAFGKVLGLEWELFEKILKEELKKEVELNLQIAKYGFDLAEPLEKIVTIKKDKCQMITGNEAIAIASVKAGLDFYCAYPMTPATSVLHHLASKKDEYKIKILQAENEISVVMTTLGAAYAGKRAMSATSGGGFALMAEGLSMSGIAEIPLVVVSSQRPGPATGIPTYSAQADLDFVTNVGHGDFMRLTLIPGDAQECAELTALAMKSAWKYQNPVIILVDKDLSEGTYTINKDTFDKIKPFEFELWNGEGEFERYKNTKSGISPLAFPGHKGAIVKVTSYEHDQSGLTIEEEVDEIVAMQEKRLRKFATIEKDFAKEKLVKVFGNKKSKTALIAWGSPKGAIIEAGEALDVKIIQPLCAQPFPVKQFQQALKGVKKIISIEANATGQMAKLLGYHGIKVDDKILKYDGRAFMVDELIEKLSKKIKK